MGGEIRVGHSDLAGVTHIIGVTVRHTSGDCLPPIKQNEVIDFDI